MLGLDNPVHILFLLVLLLVVFGARRLPEVGRSLGSGMRGFKDALTDPAQHAQGTAPGANQGMAVGVDSGTAPGENHGAAGGGQRRAVAPTPERQP